MAISVILVVTAITFCASLVFLDFFNKNSGAVTAIFTIGLTIVTAIYAALTWSISSETKLMREAQTQPSISATIQPDERYINWINLIIENIGLGPAYNVKFDVDPDFEDKYRHPDLEDRSLNYKLSDVGFIKDGLPYFAPNQKFQFFLTNLADGSQSKIPQEKIDYQKKLKTTFKIKITYEDNRHKKTYSDTYVIDFSQQRGLSQLGEPPLYKIAKNVEQIQKDINHISTGWAKLNVIRYTKEDINEEQKQISKKFDQQNKDMENTD